MGTSSCIVNNILRNLLWASVFATDINHRIYKAVCPNKGCKGECVYYPPPASQKMVIYLAAILMLLPEKFSLCHQI